MRWKATSGLVGTENLLLDGDRALEQGLAVGGAAQLPVRHGEIVEALREVGVTGRKGLLLQGERALGELLGLARPADLEVDEGEVVEAHRKLAPGACGLFLDGDGAPMQRLGVVVAAEALIDAGEIVQADRDVAMVSPERILADHQRALVERLRLGVAAEEIIGDAEVVEARGETDALVARDGRLAERHDALAQLDRLDIAALELVGAGKIAQRVDEIGAVLFRVFLEDRERAAVEVGRLVVAVLADPRARLRHQRVRGGKAVLRARRCEAGDCGCENERSGKNGKATGRHRAKHGSSFPRQSAACGPPIREF